MIVSLVAAWAWIGWIGVVISLADSLRNDGDVTWERLSWSSLPFRLVLSAILGPLYTVPFLIDRHLDEKRALLRKHFSDRDSNP